MASSGNIAVFNPLSKVGTITFSEGNTIAKHANNKENTRHGTTFNIPNTGKWYFECKFVNCVTNGSQSVMFSLHDIATEPVFSSKNFLTQAGNFISWYSWQNRVYISNSYTAYTGQIATQTSGIVGVAIDRDNSHMWVAVNNTWINGTPDFSDGTNKVASPSASLEYGLAWSGDGGGTGQFWTANFGQDSSFGGTETAQNNSDGNGHGDFYYTPPTDFLALSSANLPISDDIDPAQTDDDYIGGKQHNSIVYTGTGSGQSISGLGFRPDLVWIQNYSSQNQTARIIDSSRGATKKLEPAYTTNEGTESGVTSFDSDGFTLGSATGGYNTSSASYVSWCWRANGGTTATNSDGDSNTTVQANTAAGFSIVEWPSYSGDTKFGHGLTKTPNFIIAKLISGGSNWPTYHDGYSSGKCCFINKADAEATSSHFAHSGTGNPVSATTFGLGASFAGSGAGIAYVWHDVEGFQKFGKYVGNGNADGPFIYTGFRPKLIAQKIIDNVDNWLVYDTARRTFNPLNARLRWDADGGESTSTADTIDALSNGFKVRATSNGWNGNGHEIVYMAWGDVPFKYNNTF